MVAAKEDGEEGEVEEEEEEEDRPLSAPASTIATSRGSTAEGVTMSKCISVIGQAHSLPKNRDDTGEP